ncbi:hypothetical protein RXV86_05770 [Alisedimentitalea sp. MJ-SS2]|uniref:hypothetical protein n=1 Tax=Aliisedimentitalea sp. MJ-SS2 TaxID=3049795 RepID=UPI002906CD46|nr:hypothetical protein [Alisedimentitalea sp. MJ-SS2]MDU8926884.1 hypothetical protein [Alisedimentitalea sp. MJ-SS2]
MTRGLISQIMIGWVLLSGGVFLLMEPVLARAHLWLIRLPHRPKLALVMLVSVIAALGMTAANGLLVIGMMSAVVLETLRVVRKNQ